MSRDDIKESLFDSLNSFDNLQFLEFKKKYNLFLSEIHCRANREIFLQRFKTRSQSGERHPGHVDSYNYEEFAMTIDKGGYEAIEASDRTLEIDTTNFLSINERSLFNFIAGNL